MPEHTLWAGPVTPFVSAVVTAQIATERWHLRAYFALRHAIFVEEQRMFAESDIDEHDLIATPIVVLGHSAGMPDEVIGAVRIYPAGSGTWFGGRLGVCRPYRSRKVVGTALIFAAVSAAHACGCTRFLATVQEGNVGYFERHHFFGIRSVEVCGQPHRLMQANLAVYPPRLPEPLRPFDGADATLASQKRRAA